MRMTLFAGLFVLALFLISGCSKPEILPDERPKLAAGMQFNPEYDFPDWATFQRPGVLPGGGTKDKYLAVRDAEDKFYPVNPWRNLSEVPMQKSPYEYRNMEFEKNIETSTTDISSPELYKETDELKTLDSTNRARAAQNK